MSAKEMTLVFYGRRYARDDWKLDLDPLMLRQCLVELESELAGFGIRFTSATEDDVVIDVKGYGDILNSVRIRSPRDGIANLCLGHIIGASPNRDLLEDIRRGVNRVAFAPEMVEPEEHNKKVCHNCGCGC